MAAIKGSITKGGKTLAVCDHDEHTTKEDVYTCLHMQLHGTPGGPFVTVPTTQTASVPTSYVGRLTGRNPRSN
jgi:hypothetical protein